MKHWLVCVAAVVVALIVGGIDVTNSPGTPSIPRVAYVTGTGSSASTVWIARADGSHARRLGRGSQPLLAPDGSLVAASSTPGLVLYSASGVALRRYFETSDAIATAAAFSADSRYLAVVLSTRDPVSASFSSLAVINTATLAHRIVARGQIYGASFAPDGSDRLAYASAGSLALSARIDIHVAGADGSGAAQITHDGRSLNPVWGARGIAFDHERLRTNAEPAYQIWVMASDGSARRPLTALGIPALREGLVPTAFSADGAVLLAEYVGQDTSQAWILRLSGGRPAALGDNLVGAALSRTGRTALVDRSGFLSAPNRGVVEAWPLAGGRPRILSAHGSEPSWNV